MTDSGLADYFSDHHRLCDAAWAAVEQAVEAGDPSVVARSFAAYDRLQRHHLAMEEEIMFPAFEQATGMTSGPTEVMRGEHRQMRGILDQMVLALSGGDPEELVDQGDTLLMLIQQHNRKEEGVLYPMAQQALEATWAALLERLEGFDSESSPGG